MGVERVNCFMSDAHKVYLYMRKKCQLLFGFLKKKSETLSSHKSYNSSERWVAMIYVNSSSKVETRVYLICVRPGCLC